MKKMQKKCKIISPTQIGCVGVYIYLHCKTDGVSPK